eukprot:2806607-Prorocentrum_lima.AAC.1
MTSSLVGSEMCIRDRCDVCALRRPCRQPGQVHSMDSKSRKRHSVGCLASVSYTHLTLPTICSV